MVMLFVGGVALMLDKIEKNRLCLVAGHEGRKDMKGGRT
jgi:hypothetical protein